MNNKVDESTSTEEIHPEYKYPFHWDLDFSLNIGETNRRFFDELEEKRIMGTKCPECGDVFVPPQSVCVECYTKADEWVEVEQKGVLESYTVCFFEFRKMPEPPYVTGVIRVGDSAICMMHFIEEIEYDEPMDLVDKLEKGQEVEPVWSDDRSGDIFDIDHWRIAE
jgi:uncharacterized OB-fold protein